MTSRPRAAELSVILLTCVLTVLATGCGAPETVQASGVESPGTASSPVVPSDPSGPTAAVAAKRVAVTEDDAVAALALYLELERQVYLTGDATPAEQVVDEECLECGTRIQLAHDAYVGGLQLQGGASTVELQRLVPAEEWAGPGRADEIPPDIFVVLTTVRRAEASTIVGGVEQTVPAASYTLEATLWYDGERWFVVMLTESL